jgi:hypothetical protein
VTVDALAKQLLSKSLDGAQVASRAKNADFLLVLIAYASPGGDRDKNLRLAEDRAREVEDLLLYTDFACDKKKLLRVAVGPTKLLDTGKRGNRAVAVWEGKVDPAMVSGFVDLFPRTASTAKAEIRLDSLYFFKPVSASLFITFLEPMEVEKIHLR